MSQCTAQQMHLAGRQSPWACGSAATKLHDYESILLLKGYLNQHFVQVTPPRHQPGNAARPFGRGEDAQSVRTPGLASVTSKTKGLWGRTPIGKGRDPDKAPGSALSKLWTVIKTGGKRRVRREEAEDPAGIFPLSIPQPPSPFEPRVFRVVHISTST